ncbi:MAG: hypothetical protein H6742_11240 [Alphaproteobacteria bacterium]|nr:hypothetical protein [Alphaproteobacteria bacterium]
MAEAQGTAAEPRVVIGAGPDALRVAAVLATRGHAVRLLQQGPGASGLRWPELPQDNGRLRTSPDARDTVERVLGPLVEAPDPGLGILKDGQVHRLPLRRRELPGLLPAEQLVGAARAFLRRRSKNATEDLVAGGGQEERTYRDWVVRRMGEPTYRSLYQDHARRRFGRSPDTLSVAAARLHHAVPDPGPHQVVGGRYHVALQEAAARITDAGGSIDSGVRIAGLDVVDGRVHAVRLQKGAPVPVEGSLWVARPPSVVVGWLPDDVAAPLRVDAGLLTTCDLQVVCLKGEVDGLPETLHVLDEGAPFWAVVSPYGIKEYALFLTTVPRDAPARPADELAAEIAAAAERLGVGRFETDGVRVERVADHQPSWPQGAHGRLHRLVRGFDALGIVGVGRTGTLGFIDPAGEIAHALSLTGDAPLSPREAMRVHVDPPARLDDLGARAQDFLTR